MRASVLIALASAVALSAGASFAQSTTASDETAAAAASSTDHAYVSSGVLGDAATLKAGDPGVVSNGPVPDTPQNRAAYGRPLSHAGRATSPAGN